MQTYIKLTPHFLENLQKKLQPNGSAEDETTNQISKCLNLFFWLGSRAGGQPFYAQKALANLTKNYFDFSFWAWKPTE